MSCEIGNGYKKPACANRGGVNSFVVINAENITFTVVNGLATIDKQLKAAYELKFDIGSSFADDIWTGDRSNNSSVSVQTIMGMMKSRDLETDELAEVLANGYFKVVVRDRNGRNKIYGLENGMFLTTHEGKTGQAGTDMSGWTLNFAGEEDSKPPLISVQDVETMLTFTS